MESENNILIVLANKDFRDEEYNIPEAIYKENGIGIKVAAADPNDCIGTGGTIISPDLTFDQVNEDQFDAIMFVGGLGVERYFADESAIGLAKQFYQDKRIVSAICWAPVILAKAGIVSGKRVTGSSDSENDLVAAGGNYTGAEVEIDSNIITGNGPEASEKFAQTVTDAIIK